MFTISVPGSSANVGPGFDSAGMAVGLYLTLTVTEADSWSFTHATDIVPPVADYKDHFIYRVAEKVAQWYDTSLTPCHVVMDSDIPLARGLGSSASAIIAGIELTNQLCQLNLSDAEKLECAVKIEGHPDNVAPALFGGFVVSVKLEDGVRNKKLPPIKSDAIVYIPDVKLKTEDARKVLPEQLTLDHATTASGVSNLMVAALLTDDYELAGDMMENDLFHENYRAKLIPNYNDIKLNAKKFGAYGTVISGAGPTMISFVPEGKGISIASKMKELLPDYHVEKILLDNDGLKVKVD